MRSLQVMIRLKNRSGFTLIEVLLAVAIMGIVLGPIYILQGAVFDRVIRAAGSVDRMLAAYDFFVDVKKGDEDHIKKTISDPHADLIYEKKEPSKGSVLAKEFNHIYIEKLSWHWKYKDTSYSDVLVDIAFVPPEEKEEPEEAKQKPEDQKKPSSVASADARTTMADRQPAGSEKKGEEKKPTEVKKS